MSSSKVASSPKCRSLARKRPAVGAAANDVRQRGDAATGETLSARAIQFASEIERILDEDESALSVDAIQALMGALCRIYSVQAENGATFTPIKEGQVVSPTAVMVTAGGLLRASNLTVFELGMWKSWTGR